MMDTGQRRFGNIKATFLSLYSTELYIDVIRRWKGIGFVYYFTMLAIMFNLMIGGIYLRYQQVGRTEVAEHVYKQIATTLDPVSYDLHDQINRFLYIAQSLPSVQWDPEEKKLIGEQQLTTIIDPQTKYQIGLIDLSGRTTTLAGSKQSVFLITPDKLVLGIRRNGKLWKEKHLRFANIINKNNKKIGIGLDVINQLPWLNLKNNQMQSNVPAGYKLKMYLPREKNMNEYIHTPVIAFDTVNTQSTLKHDRYLLSVNKRFITYRNFETNETEALSYNNLNDKAAISGLANTLELLAPIALMPIAMTTIGASIIIHLITTLICSIVALFINKKLNGGLTYKQLFRLNLVATTVSVAVDNLLTIIRFPYSLYTMDWWLFFIPPIIVTYFAIKAHNAYIIKKKKEMQEQYEQPIY